MAEGGTINQWDYIQSEKRSRHTCFQLDGHRKTFAVTLTAINRQ
jgi:hypothetical protein